MKKILLNLSLLTALSLAIVSCGNRTKSVKENATEKEVMKTVQLNKADFLTMVADVDANPGSWKYLGDKPAIVDFYADWCGPCKVIAPLLDELAAEYGDQIIIYKVNVDNEQELAQAFGVRSIPTLLFIPMEGEPKVHGGAMPKSSLEELIKTELLNK